MRYLKKRCSMSLLKPLKFQMKTTAIFIAFLVAVTASNIRSPLSKAQKMAAFAEVRQLRVFN